MKFENIDGWGVFSELNVPDGGGVKVEYYLDEKDIWAPACVFPTLSETELFAPNNNQDWNAATTFMGLSMKRMMTGDAIFWNYFINFNGLPQEREVRVRLTIFGMSGKEARTSELTVEIDPGDVLFLNNWKEWQGPAVNDYENMEPNRLHDPADIPAGWYVADCIFGKPRLTLFGREKVNPLSYKPGLSGEYDLYLCFKEHLLECNLQLPNEKHPVSLEINERIIPWNKWWKEIYIGRYQFGEEDTIGIEQASATIYNSTRRFGDIYYLKLVPAVKPLPQALSSAVRTKEIVFYSEPWSIAYYYSLQNESMVERLVQEYLSLGVDKIVCQMGRIGSMVIYPSRVAQRASSGEVIGDDWQRSNGINEMMAEMDILEVLPRICHRHGIRFIANLGANVVYKGSTLETRFSLEHPEYMHPVHRHMLDLSHPEVREYAAEHFAEMARYDIDGISLDHQRYPYAHTAESMVAMHRAIVDRLGDARRKELEINIRFQADNPDFYQALQILLQEDLVDSIIPSRLMCVHPRIDIAEYVRLGREYGKKVYGCVDGWAYTYNRDNDSLIPRPQEVQALAEGYEAQGADGIFFYQSEQLLSNPFLRRLIVALKPGE